MTTINKTTRTLRLRRAAAVAVGSVLAASLSTVSAPAHAAPPANDNWDAATDVTSLAFRSRVDTTEATADAVPPAGEDRALDNSVWYHVVLPRDGRLLLSTKGTDYGHVLRLFHAADSNDTPDQWNLLDGARGGARTAAFVAKVKAGDHYYVMISNSSRGNGGIAKLLLRRPARFAYQFNQYGTLDRADGAAILKGSVKATRRVTVYLRAQVRQAAGDVVVQGWGHKTLVATRKWAPWAMRVAAGRPFHLGAARVPVSELKVYDGSALIGVYHFDRTLVTLQ